MNQSWTVTNEAAGQRLDLFLAHVTGQARSQCQKWLARGYVSHNNQPAEAGTKLKAGDRLAVELPEQGPSEPAVIPELAVVYQDNDLLIVNKPAGLVVHPGAGSPAGEATVANFARLHSTDTDPDRPGIIHRLDRDTSGLLMIARTADAKAFMQNQLASRNVHKTYSALVQGRLSPQTAVIDLPIGRNPRRPLEQAVVPNGRPAQTRYRVTAEYPGYTLLEAEPITGRTHQLRVHFAAMGHAIAGDTTYGNPQRPAGLSRQFLHATRLRCQGPHGQAIDVTAPLPTDLSAYLSRLQELV